MSICWSSTPGRAKKTSTGCATIRRQFDCAVENLSDDFTQIAIQGPKGVDLLQKLTDAELSAVKFYWVTRGTVCGLQEHSDGAAPDTPAKTDSKSTFPSDEATSARVWNEILEAGKEFGVVPCGLGSRNTLRLEGKLPLYGHEISDTINVWEAGLDRFCKMEKPRVRRSRGTGEGEGRGH